MDIQEYLDLLDECPDDELTKKLGITNNFDIILKIDEETLDGIIRDIGNSKDSDELLNGSYDIKNLPPGFTYKKRLYEISSPDGTWATLTLYGSESPEGVRTQDLELLGGNSFHYDKQASYTTDFCFHWPEWNEGTSTNGGQLRSIANVVKDFIGYLIRKELPFCLPNICSDLPEIEAVVYYDPLKS